MMPACVRADFILSPPPFRLGVLNALVNRPVPTTEPDQEGSARPHRGIADLLPRRGGLADGPLPHQPDRCVRRAICTPRHRSLGHLRCTGALSPFRPVPPIPQAVMAAVGDGLDGSRGLCCVGHQTLTKWRCRDLLSDALF
jgi:hypothetical protein